MKVSCKDYNGKVHIVDQDKLIERLSAYGIYVARGKVLLIQDPRSLRWELPGGGIEAKETIRQGLTREFIEEAGVTPKGDITLISEWEEFYYDIPTKQAWRSTRKCYLVSAISSERTLLAEGNGDDSGTAAFIPIEKLETLYISPEIRRALSTALPSNS
ncbi:MAG TPA: NUDIX domain-containing protein [Candidatus Saccharimonadales bacterium]